MRGFHIEVGPVRILGGASRAQPHVDRSLVMPPHL